jgi:hypothetical protein
MRHSFRAQSAVYKQDGIAPIVLPRSAGSWRGYVFTGEPLRLAAGHFFEPPWKLPQVPHFRKYRALAIGKGQPQINREPTASQAYLCLVATADHSTIPGELLLSGEGRGIFIGQFLENVRHPLAAQNDFGNHFLLLQ